MARRIASIAALVLMAATLVGWSANYVPVGSIAISSRCDHLVATNGVVTRLIGMAHRGGSSQAEADSRVVAWQIWLWDDADGDGASTNSIADNAANPNGWRLGAEVIGGLTRGWDGRPGDLLQGETITGLIPGRHYLILLRVISSENGYTSLRPHVGNPPLSSGSEVWAATGAGSYGVTGAGGLNGIEEDAVWYGLILNEPIDLFACGANTCPQGRLETGAWNLATGMLRDFTPGSATGVLQSDGSLIGIKGINNLAGPTATQQEANARILYWEFWIWRDTNVNGIADAPDVVDGHAGWVSVIITQSGANESHGRDGNAGELIATDPDALAVLNANIQQAGCYLIVLNVVTVDGRSSLDIRMNDSVYVADCEWDPTHPTARFGVVATGLSSIQYPQYQMINNDQVVWIRRNIRPAAPK